MPTVSPTLFRNDNNKTIVTTITSVVSDRTTKTSLMKNTVPTAIRGEDYITTTDASVSITSPFYIPGVNNICSFYTPEPVTLLMTEYVTNTSISLEVNGLYFFNGKFEGDIEIRGKNTTPTRISITHS